MTLFFNLLQRYFQLAIVLTLFPLQAFAQNTHLSTNLWTTASLPQARSASSLALLPEKYSLYTLDEEAMRSKLNYAARGSDPVDKQLEIPLPTGDIIQIMLSKTNTMAAELAAKFPQIETYNATVVGRPSVTGVVDLGELGFHGMLFMENGQHLFIDPRHDSAGKTYYISYYDKDYAPSDKHHSICLVNHPNQANPFVPQANNNTYQERPKQRFAQRSASTDLRTYRLAIAATGEYTSYHGGTTAQALSAINTTVSRVNQIYQRDLSVKFELVANNEQIIFTDKDNDPYTKNEPEQLQKDNQKTIDKLIGAENYDVGHVFSLNDKGGVANLAGVCDNDDKASATSANPDPNNDPFDINMFAHELGHQLNAHHSFNSIGEVCKDSRDDSGSIRADGTILAGSQWELGNGLSIMSYLNSCANEDDVLPFGSAAIAMFHIGNIRQMRDFIDYDKAGGSCGTVVSQNNQAPVANAGKDYTIPAQTPFSLTGSASDADSRQNLTYSWEQMDLGKAASIAEGDKGDNPLFRIFVPSSVNSRTFPQLSNILNYKFILEDPNTSIEGEVLPVTSRDLNFTLSVRDQQGGVGDDDVKLTVVNTGSVFNIIGISPAILTEAQSTTISWNVAGTNTVPISCNSVDILLSVDDGQSFATTLVQSTANDGNEVITIPTGLSSNDTSRLKIACSDNIFFNISQTLSLSASTTEPKTAKAIFKEKNSDYVNYFRLVLLTPLSVDVSVDYETRDGSGENAALAGQDYVAKSGKATLFAGQKELFIGVTIKGDTTIENDETFSLVISNPINVKFASNVAEVHATHTILNDD